jgi:hypothetical protein
MKRVLVSATLVLVLAFGARPAQAASVPFINLQTYGLELCPQSWCGAALFVGILHGQVGSNPFALGKYAVAITHDPLPDPGAASAITCGVFEFHVGLRRIEGVVLPGGVLFNNGDNTFAVRAVLFITRGGWGTLVFNGLLNHNVFPPTVVGTVGQ